MIQKAEHIVDLVDAAHEKQNERQRSHIGPSALGHVCNRFLWLSFRWAFVPSFNGRMKRLFRRGHNEERTIIADLKAIGIRVTGEQKRLHFGSHVTGSIDGIAEAGVPGNVHTPHLLEFKSHNKKSFDELAKVGVKKAKPAHVIQMQLYMHGAKLEKALYVAVCKDDDRMYCEILDRDPYIAQQYIDRAHMITTADRMPPPLSADPTYFECKWCAAHDLCHGSKLTKQVNCRTCAHSTPVDDGKWHCAHWDAEIPGADAQLQGCDEHIIHPDLTPGWPYEPAERGVIWLTPVGKIHNASDAYKSREIVANYVACASGIRDQYAQFDPEIVG